MPTPSSFYPRVFALVVAVLLGYALMLIFVPFIGPMAWAAFLAFLLYPLNLRLRRRLKGREAAAGVLTVLAPVIILLPLSALSIDFVSQISALLQRLQKSAADTRHQVAVGSTAISLDCSGQRLAGGAYGDLRGARCSPGWSPARARC